MHTNLDKIVHYIRNNSSSHVTKTEFTHSTTSFYRLTLLQAHGAPADPAFYPLRFCFPPSLVSYMLTLNDITIH